MLGATFEDQVTPIAPATAAFTDDTVATDALTVADGAYKVVFLAFPFEAYGTAATKADLMGRVLPGSAPEPSRIVRAAVTSNPTGIEGDEGHGRALPLEDVPWKSSNVQNRACTIPSVCCPTSLSRRGGGGDLARPTVLANLGPAAQAAVAHTVTEYASGHHGLAPRVAAPARARRRRRRGREESAGHRRPARAASLPPPRWRGASPAAGPSAGGRPAFGTAVNFNGTSSRDSEFTNFNAEFEPPDQGLCVGDGFVLEPVNSAYRIYRTNGSTCADPST